MSSTFNTISKSEQLYTFLKQEVARGVYKPGHRIPSERDISLKYSIGRPTVHKVLSNLVTEGVLYRESGTGTFVSTNQKKSIVLSLCIIEPSIHHESICDLFRIFEKEFPECSLETSFFPYDKIGYTDIMTWQQNYDIVICPEMLSAYFLENDFFEDITNFAEPIFQSGDFYKKTFSVYSKDNRYYGLPVIASPVMLFYNCDLLKKAGVVIKKKSLDWDEFIKLAVRLKDPDLGQFGFAFSSHRNRWPVLLMKQGIDIFDDKGKCFLKEGKQNKAKEILKNCHDFIYKYQTSPLPMVSGAKLFCQGKVAMLLASSYSIAQFNQIKELNYDVMPVPGPANLPTGLLATFIGVKKGTKDKAMALEFIRLALAHEFQEKLFMAGNAVPVRKSVVTKKKQLYKTITGEFKNSKLIIKNSNYISIMDILYEQMPMLWADMLSVTNVIENVERDINALFSCENIPGRRHMDR